jgi:hypothetical protein
MGLSSFYSWDLIQPLVQKFRPNLVDRYMPLYCRPCYKRDLNENPSHFLHHHFLPHLLALFIVCALSSSGISLHPSPWVSPPPPWPLPTCTYFNNPSQMKVRFASLSRITFSGIASCSSGDLLQGRISRHPIPMKL